MKTKPLPLKIRRLDDGARIEIQWDDRGHTGTYDSRALRLACECAACVDEMSRRPVLDPGSVPVEVRALAIKLVGAYAVHFQWSDGHGTGLYPYERLLALCPCPSCAELRRQGEAPS